MVKRKQNGVPFGVKKLFRTLSYSEKVRKFPIVFGRPPYDDEEMDKFFFHLAAIPWQGDCDVWPSDDIELDDLDGYDGPERFE